VTVWEYYEDEPEGYGSDPNPDDPLGILERDRDAELEARVYCSNCGASYHAKWSGTTCSRCDGLIGELKP
jgi:hypothetical protein